jgi:outer membrane protein TolC
MAPSRRRVAFILSAIAAVTAGALVGCSSLDLGAEPDNFVGTGVAPTRLTDHELDAVTPERSGVEVGADALMSESAVPTTASATEPTTRPGMTQPAATQADTAPKAPVEVPENLSLQQAVLAGLQNNSNLRVSLYNVPISRTGQESARAAFDPTINFSLQGGRTETASGGTTDNISGSASIKEFLPTGTTIQLGVNTANTFYTDSNTSTGANLSITQSLLRGAGLDVNLASLRQAELGTKISQYNLRATAEGLVASIELQYWQVASLEQNVLILQNALNLAQSQYEDTSRRVELGSLSPSELPAAQATVLQAKAALITAQSTLNTARLTLLQLLTPAPKPFWDRPLVLLTRPFVPVGKMDPVEQHVAVAMEMRPDLNETKLEIQQNELSVIVTKNGLLPRLDMFLTLGKTGIAANFWESVTGFDGPNYAAVLGVQGDWEPLNRSANAAYHSAQLSLEQKKETLDNLTQLAQLDVRTQYDDAESKRLLIDARHASRVAAEESLRVEQAKLKAGNGTSLNVQTALQNMVAAQLLEVQAITDYLSSLVNLYQKEGSLLYRRGIAAPGNTPVTGPAWH